MIIKLLLTERGSKILKHKTDKAVVVSRTSRKGYDSYGSLSNGDS